MSHAQSSGVQAELITNGLDLLTLDDRSRQPVKTNKTSSKTSNGGKDGPSKQKQQSREVQHNKPSKKQKDKQSLPASVKQTKGGRPHVQQPPPPPHQGPNVTTRSQARKDQLASKHSRMSDDPKQFLLPVPKPDEDYEDQAMNMPVPIKYAKKLLIILDLNGTLVHRKSKRQNSSFTQRLRCKDFLQYLALHHHVMIWSSAREQNVERLCKAIFEEAGVALPVHRWNRANFGLSPKHFAMNIQLYKQLEWVWQNPEIQSTFGREVPFCQMDTILIDDSEEKARSEPYNLIKIDEYDGTDNGRDVLGQVVAYIEKARRTNDVSCFMYVHPFRFKATEPPYQWLPITDHPQLEDCPSAYVLAAGPKAEPSEPDLHNVMPGDREEEGGGVRLPQYGIDRYCRS